MRKLILRGPYNLIAFEVLPAMVEAKIIEPPTEEFILSYRPPYGPDREVIWGIDVPEQGELGASTQKGGVATSASSVETRLKSIENAIVRLSGKLGGSDISASPDVNGSDISASPDTSSVGLDAGVEIPEDLEAEGATKPPLETL